jgi:hypothetical protein
MRFTHHKVFYWHFSFGRAEVPNRFLTVFGNEWGIAKKILSLCPVHQPVSSQDLSSAAAISA